jgi:hypothetical protein
MQPIIPLPEERAPDLMLTGEQFSRLRDVSGMHIGSPWPFEAPVLGYWTAAERTRKGRPAWFKDGCTPEKLAAAFVAMTMRAVPLDDFQLYEVEKWKSWRK